MFAFHHQLKLVCMLRPISGSVLVIDWPSFQLTASTLPFHGWCFLAASSQFYGCLVYCADCFSEEKLLSNSLIKSTRQCTHKKGGQPGKLQFGNLRLAGLRQTEVMQSFDSEAVLLCSDLWFICTSAWKFKPILCLCWP